MKLLEHILEYTLVTFRFVNQSSWMGLLVTTIFNTAIRCGVIYGLIRLVMTAVNHGSW